MVQDHRRQTDHISDARSSSVSTIRKLAPLFRTASTSTGVPLKQAAAGHIMGEIVAQDIDVHASISVCDPQHGVWIGMIPAMGHAHDAGRDVLRYLGAGHDLVEGDG